MVPIRPSSIVMIRSYLRRQAVEECLVEREAVDDVDVHGHALRGGRSLAAPARKLGAPMVRIAACAPVRSRYGVTDVQASPAFHSGVLPSACVSTGRLSRGMATMWPP